MKIVINKCYGGFSISPLAVKELAKLKGKECYFFRNPTIERDGYIPITLEEANEELMFYAFSIPNPNEYLYEHLPKHKDWRKMTEEEKELYNKRYEEIKLDTHTIDRADKDLIKIVEKLGKKANGKYADLKIVEIPDSVEWQIEEYDGVEWVSEKHRIWD